MRFNLPTTVLGRTGLRVTRLGIGGAYCQSPASTMSTPRARTATGTTNA